MTGASLVGACSSANDASVRAEPVPTSTTTTTAPCPAVSADAPGVVQVVCGEGGLLSVEIDPRDDGSSAEHLTFRGVVCRPHESAIEVVGGVEIGAEFDGPRPDFVRLHLPEPPAALGSFPAFGTLTADGRSMELTDAEGRIEVGSGMFTASIEGAGTNVHVSYTCGLEDAS